MGKMIHFFFSLSLKSFSSCVFLNFDPFSYYYFFFSSSSSTILLYFARTCVYFFARFFLPGCCFFERGWQRGLNNNNNDIKNLLARGVTKAFVAFVKRLCERERKMLIHSIREFMILSLSRVVFLV